MQNIYLKNFFVLSVLMFGFVACKDSGTSSNKQKNEDLSVQNRPPSFDESIERHFFFDESLGAALSLSSEIPDAVFTATDPDSADTLTYKLVEVDGHSGDHIHFAVDANSGQVSKNNENYDHETKDSYTFAVEVSDNASPPSIRSNPSDPYSQQYQ